MHLSFLTFAVFFSSFIFQHEYSYKAPDLRRNFHLAADNEKTCEAFLNHLTRYKGQDPVVYGYLAATHGLMANYAWSPYYKIKYVRTAARLFQEIIKKHPEQAEVRFLRYSLEYYIPRYLNMSGHLQEDRAIFLKSLFRYPHSELDPEIFRIVKSFLLKHPDVLTAQEKKQLANLKA